MGDLFSKNTTEKVENKSENKPDENKNEPVQTIQEVIEEEVVQEKVVETEMKPSALNITSNRIEVTIKHPDDQREDFHIAVITQNDERWMIYHESVFRRTPDSEEWRYVELYSTGRYFERQLTLKERLKFTKVLEEIVITLNFNGSKYIKILREIVSNTDDIKLSDFATCFDMNKLI